MITVRAATPDDAPGIAHVHVQGWHEAYTGRVPDAMLARMDERAYTDRWRETLAVGEDIPGPHGRSWVAVGEDGAIVGFATSGPCRDPDRSLDDLELYAIYVLAAHYGTGVGAALLDAAIGDRPASLWVLTDNPRAQAFYVKHGFTPDGALRDDARWGGVLHEMRMSR